MDVEQIICQYLPQIAHMSLPQSVAINPGCAKCTLLMMIT